MHSSAWLGLYYSIIKLNGRTADPSCAVSTHDLTWWRATLRARVLLYAITIELVGSGRPGQRSGHLLDGGDTPRPMLAQRSRQSYSYLEAGPARADGGPAACPPSGPGRA